METVMNDGALLFVDVDEPESASKEIASSTFIYMLVQELKARDVDAQDVLKKEFADVWDADNVSIAFDVLEERYPGIGDMPMGQAVTYIADRMVV